MLNYLNPIETHSLIVELKDGNRNRIKNLKDTIKDSLNPKYDLSVENQDTEHIEERGRTITITYDIWNGRNIAMVVNVREGYRTTRDNEDRELNPGITLRLYDRNLKELYDKIKRMFRD